MKFLYKKYQAKKKEIIEVKTDARTKVKFLTAYDFNLYQKGKTHRYYGGTFEAGTIKFVCPFDSVWHAVVEQGTYSNPLHVSANCSLLPPDRNTLSSIAIDAPDSVLNAPDEAMDAIEEAQKGLEDAVDEVVEKGTDLD